MRRMMYLLTDRPYGKDEPIGYSYDNGYYIYQVYRDDERVYNELLFERVGTALEMLLRMKPVESDNRILH